MDHPTERELEETTECFEVLVWEEPAVGAELYGL